MKKKLKSNLNPLVTIGMPIFNGEKTIKKSITSILNQNYDNFELIIINDKSTDKTKSIVLNMLKKVKIKYNFITNSSNIGATENYKKVLHKSNGRYFIYASQDDWWDKNYISTLLNLILKEKLSVVAMGDTIFYDESGRKHNKIDLKKGSFSKSYFNQAYNLLFPYKQNTLLKNNLYFHGLIDRKILLEVDKCFKGVQIMDRHYLLHLCLAGKWTHTNKTCFHRTIYKVDASLRKPHDKISYFQKKWYFHLIGIYQMINSIKNSKILSNRRKLDGFILITIFLFNRIPYMINLLIRNYFPQFHHILKQKLSFLKPLVR